MARKKTPAVPPSDLAPPDTAEQRAIAEAETRLRARRKPVQTHTKLKDESLAVGPTHLDLDGFTARLLDAFGTTSKAVIDAEMLRLSGVLQTDKPGFETRLNAALALIEGIRPENELEAVLAVQIAATHAVAMSKLSLLQSVNTIPQAESAANIATKMQRTFTMQLEALSKMRRGGQQNVRVEHVHVHAGGQAVVGTINHAGGGRGDHEIPGQADTFEARSLAYAPGAPLWSEDPERQAVPSRGGAREA